MSGLTQAQLDDLKAKRDTAKQAGDVLDVAIDALTSDDQMASDLLKAQQDLAAANLKITALTNAIAAVDTAEGDVPAAVAAAKQVAGLS